MLEQYANDPNPLDVFHELFLARAMLTDFIERYDIMIEGVQRWHGSFQEDYLKARMQWLIQVRNMTEPSVYKLESLIVDVIDSLQEAGLMDKHLDKKLNSFIERIKDFDKNERVTVDILPLAPDPLEFEKKPRQLLDIADAIRYIDTITKIVERIEQIKISKTISVDLFSRVTTAMGADAARIIDNYVSDPERERAKTELAKLWGDIRLDPQRDKWVTESQRNPPN